MRDLILEIRAQAEYQMLLSRAKVEVADELLAKFDNYEQASAVCQDTIGATENESVETENNDGEFEAV
jgi:hypothetical protein